MGHVVNPISHRISSTLVDPFLLHTRYNAHYAFLYNRLSMISSYVSCVFNSINLRQIALLDRVTVMRKQKYMHAIVTFYSSQITELWILLQQRVLTEALPNLSKRELVAKRHIGVASCKRNVVPRKRRQPRGRYFLPFKNGRGKLQSRRNVLLFVRWFLHAILRIYYLGNLFRLLRYVYSNEVSRLLGCPVLFNFVVIPQEGMSANAWATFIKNKLRRGATFGKTMSIVLPILNKIFRSGNLLGYKIVCNGRTSRRGRASSFLKSRGKFPYSTVVSYASYGYRTVILKNSICGIKVWLFFKQAPKFVNSESTFII